MLCMWKTFSPDPADDAVWSIITVSLWTKLTGDHLLRLCRFKRPLICILVIFSMESVRIQLLCKERSAWAPLSNSKRPRCRCYLFGDVHRTRNSLNHHNNQFIYSTHFVFVSLFCLYRKFHVRPFSQFVFIIKIELETSLICPIIYFHAGWRQPIRKKFVSTKLLNK